MVVGDSAVGLAVAMGVDLCELRSLRRQCPPSHPPRRSAPVPEAIGADGPRRFLATRRVDGRFHPGQDQAQRRSDSSAPFLSTRQLGFNVVATLVWIPFAIKKIMKGKTLLHDPKLWLTSLVFDYFFSFLFGFGFRERDGGPWVRLGLLGSGFVVTDILCSKAETWQANFGD
ncbi:putative dolichyl-diphosphooligosaccharide--protein glycosyltransferase subunit 3b [Quercus suber]|uniref:Dolichyl-diphosphooligosaccharide--protein glycosyltransferase subunit 3b n=1 Tax=Quercus suber TaxID=58331 RepID=A0AAW0J524_QUESU